MSSLPPPCEIIELSDDVTGFKGRRPNRPYLVIRQYPGRVRVSPLSTHDKGNSLEIPAGATWGLKEVSFTVNWSKSVDHLALRGAVPLGPLDRELCQQVVEHLNRQKRRK